jgi:hypothetical protein
MMKDPLIVYKRWSIDRTCKDNHFLANSKIDMSPIINTNTQNEKQLDERNKNQQQLYKPQKHTLQDKLLSKLQTLPKNLCLTMVPMLGPKKEE